MIIRQRGFTLIEAIVAMVLIGSLGMAIFGWINSQLLVLAHVQESNEKNRATLNILEYLSVINPMEKPEGMADLGEFKINWKSELIVDPMDGANYPTGISLYRLGLYKISLSVIKPDGSQWFVFSVDQTGYKKTRELTSIYQ